MTLWHSTLGLLLCAVALPAAALDQCPDGTLPQCQPYTGSLCADGSQPKCQVIQNKGADSTCPAACDPHANGCDPTTAPTCIFPDPRVTNPRGACACRPGYKAGGHQNSDTSKQWRLPIDKQDHRVWVAEGVRCDVLCDISSGAQSCREVAQVEEKCVGDAADAEPKRFSLGGVTDGLPLAADVPLIDFEPLLSSEFTGRAQFVREYGQNVSFSNATNVNGTYLYRRSSSLPRSVDWRNRYGRNWLSTVQDQGHCQNCWSFAVSALAETMVRIEHGIWSKRSEGDLRDSWSHLCALGESIIETMKWASGGGHGISDPECAPYHDADFPYSPCLDRSGRTVRLPSPEDVGNEFGEIGTKNRLVDQKRWLDEIGPIVAIFKVYPDFYTWNWASGEPYRRSPSDVSVTKDNHIVLVVGYDDDKGCWIARNSWGTTVQLSGYFTIGYGEANIDYWPKYGWTNVDPDPWTKRRHRNGNLVIGSGGKYHRDLEMLFSGVEIISHLARGPGNSGDVPWKLQYEVPHTNGIFERVPKTPVLGQPAVVQSSYNRDLEIVFLTNTNNLRQISFHQATKQWSFGSNSDFGDGKIAGYPGFIQNSKGGFSITVRYDDGTLRYLSSFHYSPWVLGDVIADNVIQSGPSLIQAKFGKVGHFFVVAAMYTGQMQLFWRDNDNPASSWIAGETFGSEVGGGTPVMIESSFGTNNELEAGDFELCIAVNGQVQHWRRINSDLRSGVFGAGVVGDGYWYLHQVFASDVKHVWGLVQGYLRVLQVTVETRDGTMQQWHIEQGKWKFTQVVRW